MTGAVQKNTYFFSFKEDLEFPVHSHSVYERFIGRYMYIFIVSLSFCLFFFFLADEDEIAWESEQLIKKEKKNKLMSLKEHKKLLLLRTTIKP